MTKGRTSLARLEQHGGTPADTGSDVPRDTLAEYLYRIERGEKTTVSLDWIVTDILECLETINRDLNAPSDSTTGPHHEVPRRLAYALSGMMSRCLEAIMRLRRQGSLEAAYDLAQAAWRIALGFDQVFAGDIEGIVQNVRIEENLRFHAGGNSTQGK